jgi:hypothetical protein
MLSSGWSRGSSPFLLGGAHFLSPSDKKSFSTAQPPDLGVQFLHLRFGRSLGFAATGEHIRHALDRLTFPRAHLVRMHLMLRRDLLDRLVAPQRLKRDLRLKLRP